MESHDERADELEREADRIQEPSEELKQDITDTREDWDSKTQTESVPGAMELPDEEEEDEPNKFEFEERSPDTAEAKGPAGVEDDSDDEDDESDDS
jgi:hypothetical protein